MGRLKSTLRNDIWIDNVRLVRLENSFLRVDVAPEIGGRIIRVYNKTLQIEFLWKNERLSLSPAQPGDAYDPRFYGGIDEVIPGDIPERIGTLDCPDHGELWTLQLEAQIKDDALSLRGVLPHWGLGYHKTITLRSSAPWIDMDYRIENRSGDTRIFLWKLHAAVNINADDQV